jgi:hypothetical protein
MVFEFFDWHTYINFFKVVRILYIKQHVEQKQITKLPPHL